MPKFRVWVEYQKIGTSMFLGEQVPHMVTGPVVVEANNPEQAQSAARREVQGSAKDGRVYIGKTKLVKGLA